MLLGFTRMVAVAAALSTMALYGTTARAITLDLDCSDVPDFFDGQVNNGDQASAGGVTVTFSNVINAGGGHFGYVDNHGLAFGSKYYDDIKSISLTFNKSVRIVGYEIDAVHKWAKYSGGGFTLAGATASSGYNPFHKTGDFLFQMGSIPVFRAGHLYTLTHDVYKGFTQIDELELSAVPLPASVLLLLSGIGSLVLLGRRKQT